VNRAKRFQKLIEFKNEGGSARKAQSLAIDVIGTVERLRDARFIVGSMLSNVFRLSVELHCAKNFYRGCRSEVSGVHVQTMDLLWYEDP